MFSSSRLIIGATTGVCRSCERASSAILQSSPFSLLVCRPVDWIHGKIREALRRAKNDSDPVERGEFFTIFFWRETGS